MSEALQPERWRQLRPLLDRALDLDPPARADYLREVEAQSPDLHADLLRLLARQAQAGALDGPAAGMFGERLAAAPMQPLPGQRMANKRVGPYVLRRLVGSGGMGSVYEAERVEGGFRQRVAIKLIAGVHPGLHERFARERQIVAELRHPNIPQLFDGGETEDGMPYFVLEFVEGRNLLDHADAVGADLDARLSLLVRVADALAYAHRQKVLHRDIKPSNILVNQEGAVKLLDFGIAKLLDQSGQPTLTRQLLGPMTPDFAAPEQFRGEPLGVATDIYQFGVLMFWLLAGRSPYRVDSGDTLAFARAVCDEPPLSLRQAASEPASAPDTGDPERRRRQRQRRVDLERIIGRCLAKSPGQRYPDMQALLADLEAVRSQTAPEVSQRWRRRRWRLVGLAAALMVLAGAGIALLPTGLLEWRNDWAEEPALHALGLGPQHLHVARADSEALIKRALFTEAEGDLPGALALLESVHRADPRTPVPAILIKYWTNALDGEAALNWQQEAERRLQPLDDPALDLLLKFVLSDGRGDTEESLRYSAALLQLKPEAWFLRFARAHVLSYRGLREAALRELQRIEVTRLGHRKLGDAIADRASLGDLAGAEAIHRGLRVAADDPTLILLEARLAYTRGDIAAARDRFAEAVVLAKSVGRLDVEARGLLYQGVLEGCLGRYDQAVGPLREARQRLAARGQVGFAIDAALALAQIAAIRGDPDTVRREIAWARSQPGSRTTNWRAPLIDLFEARLLGAMPAAPGDPTDAIGALVEARAASLRGERDRARLFLQWSEEQGVTEGNFLEEFVHLSRELGQPEPPLPPIDPPFQPYARYAARWPLGAGESVAPRR